MRYGWLLMLLIMLLPGVLLAQTQGAFQAMDTLGNPVYVVSEGMVRNFADNKVLLTVRGNIVYKDSTEEREKMTLLVRMENLFNKTTGVGLKYDMHTVLFSITQGQFYLGDNGVGNPAWLMAYYKVDNKGALKLFDGQTNKTIATINGNSMTAGELSAVFYLYMNKLGLDKSIQTAAKAAAPVATNTREVAQTKGTIKRVWNTNQDEFVWDGISIKRKWNSLGDEEWLFDGRNLKKAWATGQDEFSWDGTILKRRFNTGTDEFEWDGKILRRRYNTGQDEYSISGSIVKRLWNNGTDDEWEIDGEVPIPLVAMVVFGLLSK